MENSQAGSQSKGGRRVEGDEGRGEGGRGRGREEVGGGQLNLKENVTIGSVWPSEASCVPLNFTLCTLNFHHAFSAHVSVTALSGVINTLKHGRTLFC